MSQVDDRARIELGLGFDRQAIRYPLTKLLGVEDKLRAKVTGRGWASSYHRKLWIIDTFIICGVVAVSHLARFGLEGARFRAGEWPVTYLALSIGLVLVWVAALEVNRSRDARVVGIGSDEYKRVAGASVTVFGLFAIVCVAFKLDIARGYISYAFPLGMASLLIARWVMRYWLTKQREYGHYLSRVIVLGQPRDVKYVIGQIQKKSGAAYNVVGAAVPDAERRTFLRVDATHTVNVISDLRSVVDAVSSVEADAVIVAGPVKGGSKFIRELGWALEESATELVLATGLTNVAGPRIHARPVEGLPLMHVELPQYAGAKHMLKRLLDITLSATSLLLLLPVFLVLTVLIRRDSEGPVLFAQERTGRGGKIFRMYKFRSMVTTAERDLAGLLDSNEGAGPLFKLKNDPRVTAVGKWMRRYSLDELPQIWNVLIGDMSLVGPRPPLPREVDDYARRVHRRLYIKPGLTGMWQINGRSELSWEDSVRLDLYYVENWSITGDLMIIWRTFKVLLAPVGAY